MPSSTTTIKVQRELRDRLARLAADRHASMASVIGQAVERMEAETFLARAHADLVRFREEDPQGWAADRAEARRWEDATIADGLGANDWHPSDWA